MGAYMHPSERRRNILSLAVDDGELEAVEAAAFPRESKSETLRRLVKAGLQAEDERLAREYPQGWQAP